MIVFRQILNHFIKALDPENKETDRNKDDKKSFYELIESADFNHKYDFDDIRLQFPGNPIIKPEEASKTIFLY